MAPSSCPRAFFSEEAFPEWKVPAFVPVPQPTPSARKRRAAASDRCLECSASFLCSLPGIVYQADEEGRIILLTHLDWLGVSSQELAAGRHALSFFPLEERQRVQRNITRVLCGGNIGANEYLMLRADGTSFPVVIHTDPVVRNGRPVGIRGIIVDVSTRRRVRAALAEKERTIRALLDAQPDPMLLVDASGRLLEGNTALGGALGSTLETLRGQRVHRLFPGEIGDTRFHHLSQAFTHNTPVVFTDRRNGKTFEHHIIPIAVAEQPPDRAAILARDVTSLTDLLADAEERARFLRVLNEIGRSLSQDPHLSQETMAQIGILVEKALFPEGEGGRIALLIFDGDRTPTSRSKETVLLKQPLRMPPDRVSTISVCGRFPPNRQPNLAPAAEEFLGRVLEQVGWAVSRCHAEQEEERHKEELAHAARLAAIGEIASEVAHEVSQPLYAIKALAQNAGAFLERPAPDLATIKENMALIAAQVDRMAGILGNMKSLAGKSPFQLARGDLREVVERVAGLVEKGLHQAGISFRVQVPKTPVIVLFDGIRLEQVILNLLQNSRDSRPPACPFRITLSRRRQRPGIRQSDRRAAVPTLFYDQGAGPGDGPGPVHRAAHHSSASGTDRGARSARQRSHVSD